MTLNDFIKRLQDLANLGYGELPVYATHGASGATDRMGNPRVTEVFGTMETGDPGWQQVCRCLHWQLATRTMIVLIKLILALIASYHLGGWWAVLLCFCVLELILHAAENNK